MLKTKLKDGTLLMDYIKNVVIRDTRKWDTFSNMIEQKEKHPTKHLGITVRKNKSMPIEEFLKICLKLPKYKWFKDYTYSIEFHTESGYFPHVHIALAKWDKLTLPKADLIRNIKRIFKQPNDSQIQVDILTTEHHERLKQYIKGDKKDLEKTPLIILDKEERLKHQLDDFYE